MTTLKDPVQIKAKLHHLANHSAALSSLPPEGKKARIGIMLAAGTDTMLEYISVLEKEAGTVEKIDTNFVKKAKEIEGMVAEAEALEKEAELAIRQGEEAEDKEQGEAAAAALLKKLDDITN